MLRLANLTIKWVDDSLLIVLWLSFVLFVWLFFLVARYSFSKSWCMVFHSRVYTAKILLLWTLLAWASWRWLCPSPSFLPILNQSSNILFFPDEYSLVAVATNLFYSDIFSFIFSVLIKILGSSKILSIGDRFRCLLLLLL